MIDLNIQNLNRFFGKKTACVKKTCPLYSGLVKESKNFEFLCFFGESYKT